MANFQNLKARKRTEIPKFVVPPVGEYLFTVLGVKECGSENTGSSGIQVQLRIEAAGADVAYTDDITEKDVLGKKQSTRFWIEDKDGEVMGSAAFAGQFLNAIYGEKGWDDMLEAFDGLEGRSVRGRVSHRIDTSKGDAKVYADIGDFKAA